MRIVRALLRSAATTLALLASAAAWPQAYPAKPVVIVVPYPAGGVVDIIARIVAEKMGAAMKATFVVENRPGAGGTIGAGTVARAAPDGYTLLVGGSATHVFAPSMYKKTLTYDPIASFAPIGQISASPLVVVVGSKTPAATLPELVDFLRKSGDKANYASNGAGTFPQLAAELFKQANQLQTTHVPYTGGPAAVTALVQGDVAVSVNHIAVVQGMVKAGKLKAIATTGNERSPAFPDLPTLDELGMKIEANTWFGLFAPAGTPKPIVDRLGTELATVLKDESVRARLAQSGEEARFRPPETFAPYHAAELAKWSKVIREARISLD